MWPDGQGVWVEAATRRGGLLGGRSFSSDINVSKQCGLQPLRTISMSAMPTCEIVLRVKSYKFPVRTTNRDPGGRFVRGAGTRVTPLCALCVSVANLKMTPV